MNTRTDGPRGPSWRRLLAGRRVVLPATVGSQLIALLRNTLIARLLGPEQYGLATTFLLAQFAIDSATDTGLNKFVLTDRQGHRPAAQATVQLIAALRGVLIALLIVGIAYPLFRWLDLSHDLEPFLLLGLTSISVGLLHYDNARQQRNGRFVNDSLSTLLGDVAALAVSVAALAQTRSYIVVLFSIAARGLVICLVSHLMAKRRYRLAFSPAIAAQVFRFSWPLLINGPLLFIAGQADRLLVGAVLGQRDLGTYSAALLLMMLPLGLLTRILGTISLPRLSAAYRAGNMAAAEAEFTGAMITVFLLATTGFSAVGSAFVTGFYGPAFALASLPITLIGLAQATRFLRTWPASIAFATARTGNVLLSNVVRLLALPMAFVGLMIEKGIAGLAAGLLAGEMLALLISLLMLNRSRGLQASHGMGVFTIAAAVAIALPLAQPSHADPLLGGLAAVGVLVIAMGSLWLHDRRLVPRNLQLFGW